MDATEMRRRALEVDPPAPAVTPIDELELAPPIQVRLAESPVARPDDRAMPIGEDEDGTPIFAEPPGPHSAIPSNCLRVLGAPPGMAHASCKADCVGIQRDGGCLCDVVRAAQAAGVEWSFEVDPVDDRWVYNGPPLP